MIAELYGKISSTGSNLSDRLEDNLTGDFFGVLRYISFNKVMKILLTRTKILKRLDYDLLHIISEMGLEYWDKNISFWPYDSLGEFDVLIELDKIVIGIEVKLHSGLSSDDKVDRTLQQNINEQSINQLAKESRILNSKIKSNNKLALLILIAPEDKCSLICNDVFKRDIIEDGIEFGYLSWEEILECLKQILMSNKLNHYERIIINDLIALLKRKGLEKFTNFIFETDDINITLWFNFNDNNEKTIINCNRNVDLGGYYEFK